MMMLTSDENENDYEYNVDDNAVGLWIYLSVILAGQIEFKSTLKWNLKVAGVRGPRTN